MKIEIEIEIEDQGVLAAFNQQFIPARGEREEEPAGQRVPPLTTSCAKICTCPTFCTGGIAVDAVPYTRVRNNLAKMLDKVNDDHAPVLITRRRGKPAVLLSLEDFDAYEETAYLLRSPRNAARLRRAVRALQAGKGKAHKLVR